MYFFNHYFSIHSSFNTVVYPVTNITQFRTIMFLKGSPGTVTDTSEKNLPEIIIHIYFTFFPSKQHLRQMTCWLSALLFLNLVFPESLFRQVNEVLHIGGWIVRPKPTPHPPPPLSSPNGGIKRAGSAFRFNSSLIVHCVDEDMSPKSLCCGINYFAICSALFPSARMSSRNFANSCKSLTSLCMVFFFSFLFCFPQILVFWQGNKFPVSAEQDSSWT